MFYYDLWQTYNLLILDPFQGISLNIDQFTIFIEQLPEIEKALKSKGITIPRPEYGGARASLEAEEPTEEENEEEEEEGEEGEEEEGAEGEGGERAEGAAGEGESGQRGGEGGE